MTEKDVYSSLGKMTEEMYLGLAKVQSTRMQDQLVAYHGTAEGKIAELLSAMSGKSEGEILREQERKVQILKDDFQQLKHDIDSKYKVYIRGCGKAGKSTLLNALLSIDENTGSRMGRLPMTFTIDTYSDELEVNKAQVRLIDEKGRGQTLSVSRAQAIAMESEEETAFKQSKEKCDAIIAERTANVYLESERDDIKHDIYKSHLLKTKIREIKWGIGRNDFFHNCILIDTPGLEQDLRFTNVIEDVKNYEVDGIIWVISSDTLTKQEVINAYKKEIQELESVYENKKVIAVINMYGLGTDYTYGSKKWKKLERNARKVYCGTYGFDDLICLNAKLAYDGNVNHNQTQIEESNIYELRKKINEMFIEKTSEEYHYAKLEKIEFFLKNLYREVMKNRIVLQKYMFQYKDKKDKISNQANACEELFNQKKNALISQHMAKVRNRIEKNMTRINGLDDESISSRQYFLENTIIGVNELENKVYDCMQQCEKLIYQRFQEQQAESIISGFKTKKYALEAFRKYGKDLTAENHRTTIHINPPSGLGAEIYDVAVGVFGKDHIVTRGVKWLRNLWKSPQDRVYEDVRKAVKHWTDTVSLDDLIHTYEEQCYKTLNTSMEYTCGAYEDVCRIHEDMTAFIENPPHMEWEGIDFMDIIGEEYV